MPSMRPLRSSVKSALIAASENLRSCEPLALLVAGEVQEELEHLGPVAGQVALQVVDVLEAVGPERAVDLRVRDALGLRQLGADADD